MHNALFFEDCKSLRRCTIFTVLWSKEPQSRFIALLPKATPKRQLSAYLHRGLAGDDLLLLEVVAVIVYSDSGVASGKLSFYVNA